MVCPKPRILMSNIFELSSVLDWKLKQNKLTDYYLLKLNIWPIMLNDTEMTKRTFLGYSGQ